MHIRRGLIHIAHGSKGKTSRRQVPALYLGKYAMNSASLGDEEDQGLWKLTYIPAGLVIPFSPRDLSIFSKEQREYLDSWSYVYTESAALNMLKVLHSVHHLSIDEATEILSEFVEIPPGLGRIRDRSAELWTFGDLVCFAAEEQAGAAVWVPPPEPTE